MSMSKLAKILLVILLLTALIGCQKKNTLPDGYGDDDYDPALVKGFDYKLNKQYELPGIQSIAYSDSIEYVVLGSFLGVCDSEHKLTADNEIKNEIFDIDVYKNEIYVAEKAEDTGKIVISIYRSDNLKAERTYETELEECAGLTVEDDYYLIWLYSNGSLYLYDLEGNYNNTITLNNAPEHVNGISYYDGWIYLAAQEGLFRYQVNMNSVEWNIVQEYESDKAFKGLTFIKENRQLVTTDGHNVYVYDMKRLDTLTDYSFEKYWLETSDDKDTDVFFILPWVNLKSTVSDNEDVNNYRTVSRFNRVLKMEEGIFTEHCNVYAPLYRQANIGTYLSQDGLVSMNITVPEKTDEYYKRALADIENAFAYYLEHYNSNRPFIIFGYGEGAQLAISLLEKYAKDDSFKKKLIAVYAIGISITDEILKNHPELQMAQSKDDLGVIISYSAVDQRAELSETYSYSINPLSWTTEDKIAMKQENLGYASADPNGSITSEIPEYCGAYIDINSGKLIVYGIENQDDLYNSNNAPFHQGDYQLYNLNFFYRNLEENVLTRIEAYRDRH